MRLAAMAHASREQSRTALANGDWSAALGHARRAQELCVTRSGQALLAVATALTARERTGAGEQNA